MQRGRPARPAAERSKAIAGLASRIADAHHFSHAHCIYRLSFNARGPMFSAPRRRDFPSTVSSPGRCRKQLAQPSRSPPIEGATRTRKLREAHSSRARLLDSISGRCLPHFASMITITSRDSKSAGIDITCSTIRPADADQRRSLLYFICRFRRLTRPSFPRFRACITLW